jgi:hypothetical protein
MASNNVVYIEDPNSVNINNNMINAIPQYQDMHIFAELTAKRKGRTVLVSTEGHTYETKKTGLEDSLLVNFLGVNQNADSPNYLRFTTNYYDGSTGNETQYEGFGITSIKTLINSSFIPQVNIQFVDIRGVTFFNQENSPYRVLFDFPPPIFNLKIKGYYGKTLEYDLHLVKYTTEFKAENGNFIIDAQFVALTYAPLSDVLFRYSINFPLMLSGNTSTPSTETPPKNTNDLVLKLKNLYSAISDQIKTDEISTQYDNTLKKITQNAELLGILSNYKNDLNEKGTAYIFVNDISQSENQYLTRTSDQIMSNVLNNPATEVNAESIITQLNTLSDYDKYVKELSSYTLPSNYVNRLYIGYMIGVNRPPAVLNNATDMNNALKTYRGLLLKRVKDATTTIKFSDDDILQPITFNNNYNITNGTYISDGTTKYVAIDVTNFYLKLYRQKVELDKSKTALSSTINTKINSMILNQLGMRPTIYNIFKILLDDVDIFFKTMKETSDRAEDHHEKYKNIIAGSQLRDSGNKASEKIYSFPLLIDQKPVTGGLREERVSPQRIDKMLPEPFPESKLVNDFIQSFTTQRQQNALANMKSEQNDDGSNKWFPISPVDSQLVGNNVKSPYADIDTSTGGGQQSVNVSPDARITQVFKIVLDRFYMLSQGFIPNSFYGSTSDVNNAYVELYANSEAINLATSVTQTNYASVLKEFASQFNGRVDNFYNYLDANKEFTDTYAFPDNSKLEINNIYVDKENPNYVGSTVYNNTIEELVITSGSTKPIDTFVSGIQKSGSWFSRILGNTAPEQSYVFTKQNVLYVKDDFVENNKVVEADKKTKYNDTNLQTRYLVNMNTVKRPNNDPNKVNVSGKNTATLDAMSLLVDKGNAAFTDIGGPVSPYANKLDSFSNIIDTWVEQLSKNNNDDAIFTDDSIINQESTAFNIKLSVLLFSSNFGYTLSPFNNSPKNLNKFVFQNTAAIAVPNYLPPYIGVLANANNEFVSQIADFYLTGSGKYLDSAGLYSFADIHDINAYLSTRDKYHYMEKYGSFVTTYRKDILPQISKLYDDAKAMIATGSTKSDAYRTLLDPNSKKNQGGKYFSLIIQPLLKEVSILCYSQNSFSSATTPATYTSLKSTNTNASKKAINDKYFKLFFSKLVQTIADKEKQQKETEDENKKLTGDEDVINQTYYSFKNINDKWLCNNNYTSTHGYPFAKDKRLIDLFAFVDRAMNPIGDTILNAEALITLSEDTTVSIFSVISTLLSQNGFIFFPIQNFMSYTEQSWNDCFKIDVDGTVPQTPAFICMYVGGTASYPTDVGGGFKNDGIEDIGNTDLSDFNTKPENPVSSDDNQVEGTGFNFYRQVRAFKVKFGQQNQSMFIDVKIDSKEYPETNESLKILSKLAGDNKLNAPIPKGQNLYNVYENRAYRATVNGFGNAMIQPTQYFQLDNIPIFNGAYLILSVEHTIEPNKMMTSFSGTKILKYPVPRVLNPSAIIGYDGGDSSETQTIASSSAGQIGTGVSGSVTLGTGTNNVADKAKYNSMYTFKIQ